MTRNEAHTKIIQAANTYRWNRARRHRLVMPKLYTMRHICQAVAVVRQWSLVDDDVLMAAGFNLPR